MSVGSQVPYSAEHPKKLAPAELELRVGDRFCAISGQATGSAIGALACGAGRFATVWRAIPGNRTGGMALSSGRFTGFGQCSRWPCGTSSLVQRSGDEVGSYIRLLSVFLRGADHPAIAGRTGGVPRATRDVFVSTARPSLRDGLPSSPTGGRKGRTNPAAKGHPTQRL